MSTKSERCDENGPELTADGQSRTGREGGREESVCEQHSTIRANEGKLKWRRGCADRGTERARERERLGEMVIKGNRE